MSGWCWEPCCRRWCLSDDEPDDIRPGHHHQEHQEFFKNIQQTSQATTKEITLMTISCCFCFRNVTPAQTSYSPTTTQQCITRHNSALTEHWYGLIKIHCHKNMVGVMVWLVGSSSKDVFKTLFSLFQVEQLSQELDPQSEGWGGGWEHGWPWYTVLQCETWDWSQAETETDTDQDQECAQHLWQATEVWQHWSINNSNNFDWNNFYLNNIDSNNFVSKILIQIILTQIILT